MKAGFFISGILIGVLLGWYFFSNKESLDTSSESKSVSLLENWNWPDSLDALIAAPKNHELVFQDDEVRVLKVTVVPGVTDPIHTHKGKSIVWVTQTSPILYNVYDFDEQGRFKLVRTDTINIKNDELFKGMTENPEPPHSVDNIGVDTFQLYRIEYKQ